MTTFYQYDSHFIYVGAINIDDESITSVDMAITQGPPSLSNIEVARWEHDKWVVLPERPNFKALHKIDFLKLFTQSERIAIFAEAKNNVAIADWEYMLSHSTTISLFDTEILAGIPALEMMGLIGVGRSAQILAGCPPQ
jgi:hypothetical protein